jgi:hypothetical protein
MGLTRVRWGLRDGGAASDIRCTASSGECPAELHFVSVGVVELAAQLSEAVACHEDQRRRMVLVLTLMLIVGAGGAEEDFQAREVENRVLGTASGEARVGVPV